MEILDLIGWINKKIKSYWGKSCNYNSSNFDIIKKNK